MLEIGFLGLAQLIGVEVWVRLKNGCILGLTTNNNSLVTRLRPAHLPMPLFLAFLGALYQVNVKCFIENMAD